MDCQNRITFRKFQRYFKNYEYVPEWRLFVNGKRHKRYSICVIQGTRGDAYGLSICVVGEAQYFKTLIEAKKALAIIFNNERKYEMKMPL